MAYDKARDQERDWHAPAMRRAVEGAAACAVKLSRWDEAARHLEDYIAHNRNSVEEVAGQRLLAALCSNALDREMPGSESDRLSDACPKATDGLDAVGRLEHARDVAAGLLAALPADANASAHQRITKEWIGSDVDLATLLTREKGRLRDDDSDWWLDSAVAQEDRDPANDDPRGVAAGVPPVSGSSCSPARVASPAGRQAASTDHAGRLRSRVDASRQNPLPARGGRTTRHVRRPGRCGEGDFSPGDAGAGQLRQASLRRMDGLAEQRRVRLRTLPRKAAPAACHRHENLAVAGRSGAHAGGRPAGSRRFVRGRKPARPARRRVGALPAERARARGTVRTRALSPEP